MESILIFIKDNLIPILVAALGSAAAATIYIRLNSKRNTSDNKVTQKNITIKGDGNIAGRDNRVK